MVAAADRFLGRVTTRRLQLRPVGCAGHPAAGPGVAAAYGLGEPVIFAQYAGTLSCPPAAAISLLKAAECLRALGLACS